MVPGKLLSKYQRALEERPVNLALSNSHGPNHMSEVNAKRKRGLPEEARRQRAVESNHWWDRQHSLVLRQTPRWAQSFVLALIFLGSGAILAGFIIRIDEVVSLKGKLEPSGGSIDVKTPAGGLISNVYVNEGDKVKKGQLLVRFDTRNASNRINSYKEQLYELNLSEKATLAAMNSRKETLQRNYETNIDILERMKPLASVGALQMNAILQQKDKALDLKSQAQQMDQNIASYLSENRRRRSELEAQLAIVKIKKQYETVTAPIDGIVFQLKAGAQGVLRDSEPILKLIPQEGLTAKVWVTNKDVGFVKIGQKADIRVDAFDYTQFGTIKAKVSSIGADVLPPNQEFPTYRFPLKLSLNKTALKGGDIIVPLRSGLAITANLRLRDKRIIALISDLFSSQFDALRSLRQ